MALNFKKKKYFNVFKIHKNKFRLRNIYLDNFLWQVKIFMAQKVFLWMAQLFPLLITVFLCAKKIWLKAVYEKFVMFGSPKRNFLESIRSKRKPRFNLNKSFLDDLVKSITSQFSWKSKGKENVKFGWLWSQFVENMRNISNMCCKGNSEAFPRGF